MNKVEVVLGDELFAFSSFVQWVNKAGSWYSQYNANKTNSITIDAVGRICMIGKQFMIARDEGTFPVKVYRIGA